MKFYLGKTLELLGMLIVGAALMAGVGITPSGQPSMTQEFLLLGIGAVVFTLGWLLERGSRAG
jgi:hypothetical protein